MRVDVVTLFPEMFDSVMGASMLGIAREQGALEFFVHDLRNWTHDRHRTADDYPYGGGQGMVMKAEPILDAIDAVTALDERRPTIIFTSPAGQRFSQAIAADLSGHQRLLFVCGRYEGIDERAFSVADMELSIGDYVLTGGELAAMVVVDAVTRLIPGVLGHELSAVDETFADGLLEYPQYTRPATVRGMNVPEVLLGGNHAKIAEWRADQSRIRTQERRPDLLEPGASPTSPSE